MSGRRLRLDELERHAAAHAADWGAIDLSTPIDRRRPFVCASQTPLYYSDVYRELTAEQALRYNQLIGLTFNEVISFFETYFARNMLAALTARAGGLPPGLAAAIRGFAEDERRHTAAFRALNRLSAPDWYRNTDHFISRVPGAAVPLLRFVARRPALFPAVLWIALIMEEKSLATSRALIRAGDDVIEPHYLAVYRAHLQDEVRHVHIDWHLLEHYYGQRSRALRTFNARLFGFLITRFFLVPSRTGRRVVELLVAERPELRPMRRRLLRALAEVGRHPAYRRMMYSPEVAPITFSLFERFAELRPLERRLLAGDTQ